MSWGFRGLSECVAECKKGFGKVVVLGESTVINVDNRIAEGKPIFSSMDAEHNSRRKTIKKMMISGLGFGTAASFGSLL